MYRFALRPRWLLTHAGVAIIIGLFGLAGFWQLDRLTERRERNEFVLERRALPVATIDAFANDPDAAAQRRVRLSGRYDTEREVILQGRGDEGRPGSHLLTPLVTGGDEAVIVDRGWIPAESGITTAPPKGKVEVTGIVLPSEGAGPLGAGSEDTRLPREISRVDVARLSRHLPRETFPLYVALQSQHPEQDLPDPITLSSLSEGPHMLYAIQWFLFIVIGVVGYGAILRRESRKSLSPD